MTTARTGSGTGARGSAALGWLLFWTLLCTPAPGARAETTRYAPPTCGPGELSAAAEARLLDCYAPVFLVKDSERSYNRIGTPSASRGWFGRTRVRVDPERPALYTQLRRDVIAGRPVLQLVYRVHFEKIPLRFSPFFFEAHRNPGLLLLVTLDEATREPWFVTAVHTCGCYMGLIPTESVPGAWLPNRWPQHVLDVYGQNLPAKLASFDPRRSRLEVVIASQSHRFTAVSVVPADVGAAAGTDAASRDLPLVPLEQLYRLPVEGTQRVISFFHDSGLLRGRVRGAWNPLEGLTLFGLAALDPTVGTDKDFGDPRETGVRFYTFLSFWRHEQSRLDRFDGLLRASGFELPSLQAASSAE